MDRPFRYSPPPPAPRSFVRPRIHRRLARRWDRRVITLVAGPGFGKTTALVHALAENELDPQGRDVWLGCEPADASASTLLAALEFGITGVRAARTSETTVDDVCSAIWALAPLHVCLVLDDAHAIEPGSPGDIALVDLAGALPANGHLVIASRRTISVPLARLLGQSLADEIGEDSLRLVDDEIAALAQAHDVELADMREVQGWPALVELVASAGGDAATRFVGEEVLTGLGDERRRALALLSAIGGAGAEVAEAVCGHALHPADFADIPLVATDRSGAIRPHALWEQFLDGELDADEVPAARLAAATTLQGRGRHAEAFELLVAASAWEPALPVLFDACNDHVEPPWADVMERWCRLLPGAFADRPHVKYARGMIARGTDPWLPTVSLIEDACLELSRAGDRRRAIAAGVRASFTSIVRNDATWCGRGTDALREREARGEPLTDTQSLTLATVELIEGRHRDCIRHAASCGDLEPRLRHFPGYFTGVSLLGLGEPDAALAPALEGAAAAQAIVPAGGSCWATSLPDAARLAAGRWSELDLDRLVDPGRRYSIAERVPLMALGVIARANTGLVDEAAEMLDAIDAMLSPATSRPLVDGWRAVAAAAVACADGDEARAEAVLGPGLDGGEFRAGGSGQALSWFPAHAWLTSLHWRSTLEALEHGAHRRRVLAACRAVAAARDGGRPDPADLELFDDVDAAVAALGVRIVIEMVARGSLTDCLAVAHGLIDRWPDAVRRLLHLHLSGPDEVTRRGAQHVVSSLAMPPSYRVRIEMTGIPRLAIDGVEVADPNWRRSRVRQLLACMVLHRLLRRQRLAELLWPEATEAAASANLRMTLSYVQALLEPGRGRGDAPWFLRQDAGVLTLRPCTELEVDVWSFEEHLALAEQHRSEGRPSLELAHLELALAHWHGDPFDDLVEMEWAIAPRERLRARFVAGSERAAALLEAAGRRSDAEAAAERGLDVDPWSEPLHLRVIRARLAAGDRPGAMAAFERCRRAMDDLGVPVPRAITDLLSPS